ncbi:type II toxin-antitoxin system YafO family toxin [Ewingella americana]|uniref:Uncharacterized protein n=1 Tax=Ewingella americana TaxID=41202 RepID=A0A502GEA1_9GAMM|nr:type II toxin-antitoxin system YafO family toxin [Ewingella americana]TPG59952.1 hypothetical protein EAH77_15405 [Ewingella americana]
MSSRVFKSPLFETYMQVPELRQASKTLFEDFKAYIQKGSQDDFAFGRDSKYDHGDSPDWLRSSSLRHVHVLPLEDFKKKRAASGKIDKFRIVSELHIIYCSVNVNNQNYVCAIAGVCPDAHNFAKQHKDVLRKCVEIAEKFETHIHDLSRKPTLASYLNPHHIAASHNPIKAAIIRALLPIIFPHSHMFVED